MNHTGTSRREDNFGLFSFQTANAEFGDCLLSWGGKSNHMSEAVTQCTNTGTREGDEKGTQTLFSLIQRWGFFYSGITNVIAISL